MIAQVQKWITLSLLGAALLWANYFAHRNEPVWAWAGALLLIFGYAIFLAIEFALLAYSQNSSSGVPPAGAKLLFRAWCGEIMTAPLVFCWRQPFRTHAEPNFLPVDAQDRRGVLLVHGFFCNRALWNPWMSKLRRNGTPFTAVTLEPAFGSIDEYVQTIDAAARDIESATGLAPVVVAHSMGGLAVRAWLATAGNAAKAHHVITIGTPHQGTWLARFGRTRNVSQMRINSAWLQQLAAKEAPSFQAKFTCFFSDCDNIVFPASKATLIGAHNQHVAGAAHVQLAFRKEPFNELQRWVGLAADQQQHATSATVSAPPSNSQPADSPERTS
jgi:triacylglycerol lipase